MINARLCEKVTLAFFFVRQDILIAFLNCRTKTPKRFKYEDEMLRL